MSNILKYTNLAYLISNSILFVHLLFPRQHPSLLIISNIKQYPFRSCAVSLNFYYDELHVLALSWKNEIVQAISANHNHQLLPIIQHNLLQLHGLVSIKMPTKIPLQLHGLPIILLLLSLAAPTSAALQVGFYKGKCGFRDVESVVKRRCHRRTRRRSNPRCCSSSLTLP